MAEFSGVFSQEAVIEEKKAKDKKEFIEGKIGRVVLDGHLHHDHCTDVNVS